MSISNKKSAKKSNVTTVSASTLDAFAQALGKGTKRLTAKERQRQLKLRTGGIDTTRTLATLATRHKLGEMVDVPGMLANVEKLESLQPLLDSATNLQETLHDLVLMAAGDAWRSATTIYTILQRMAVNDPRIADELAPVAAKFAKKGVSAAPAEPAPMVTASSTPATVTTPAAKQ